MSTDYPTALDVLTNPTSTDTLDNPSHSDQHSDLNDAVEAIEAKVGLSGTAFPVSPSTGDRFRRTDQDLEYFYDGTRWLSTNVFVHTQDTTSLSAASASGVMKTGLTLPRPLGNLIQVVYMQLVFAVAAGGTALSASHKWVLQVNGSPSDALLCAVTIDSGVSAGTGRRIEASATGILNSAHVFGYLLATKTGTPGNITVHGFSMTYRMIGV